MFRARFHTSALALGLAMSLMLTSAPGRAASATDEVWFAFDAAKAGVAYPAFVNSGSAPTQQSLKSLNGGSIVSANATGIGSMVANFPNYVDGASLPRAVIAVSNSTTTDVLEPRTRAFVVGARIKLDATNEGLPYDDGNNIIQRGTYNEPAQFKLQVDNMRLGCRVKGAKGAVSVLFPTALAANTWYAVSCQRVVTGQGEQVVVSVARILSDGQLGNTTVLASPVAPIGDLDFPLSEPLSVGAKLNPNGTIVSGSCDPFNGLLDDPYLNIA